MFFAGKAPSCCERTRDATQGTMIGVPRLVTNKAKLGRQQWL
jgi:hypothetical protein